MNSLDSSFRDNAGFLFTKNETLYRAITQAGKDDYDLFLSSGLYQKLLNEKKIIAHEEILDFPLTDFQIPIYKVIQPHKIPFISYPYEWSFAQFKEAALLTLEIQLAALSCNLSLKDASFFNVQFLGSKPVFIDTLSFEKRLDTPWVAYRQFCQHFLAPLLLMAHVAPNFNQSLTSFLDGVPLPLASKLLPWKAKTKMGVFLHIVMHSQSQKKHEDKSKPEQNQKPGLQSFGLTRQMALIDSLISTVKKIQPQKVKTEWIDYTQGNNNYTQPADAFKKEQVAQILQNAKPKSVWDFGGNTGTYSRLATKLGIHAICFDIDPLCVEQNYVHSQKNSDELMLPLIMDLGNPSPAIGWAHRERHSLAQRGPADLVMALALIHHLRITANIPLERISEFFSQCGKNLIIEFIPKSDSMVATLLRFREDIFSDYTQEQFEKSFAKNFPHFEKWEIPDSVRTLYYFKAGL